MSRRVLLGSALSCACVGVIGTLGACGGIISSFRPSTGGVRGPGVPPSTNDVFGTGALAAGRDTTLLGRPRNRPRATPNGGSVLGEQRVCRASSTPNGWIAVAYEVSPSDRCPGPAGLGRDSVATVAVIVRYAAAPIGTQLDVCVDQPIPSGWTWASDEPSDPGACPQAAPRDQSTVRRIERTF